MAPDAKSFPEEIEMNTQVYLSRRRRTPGCEMLADLLQSGNEHFEDDIIMTGIILTDV